MAERVTDPEALEVWEAVALQELIGHVSDSTHRGARAHTILGVVTKLREDPDLAARLGIGVPLR